MEELLEILSDINPEADFENSDDLMGEGLLTSFDMVVLVSRINQELGISIPANEIIPENFKSAETIYALMERLDED